VNASIASRAKTSVLAWSGVRLSANAPATAPAAIASIVGLDPKRVIRAPPHKAPTTPPRLKTVMPLLASAGPSPAPAMIDGSQLNPRYTDSRHEKNAVQSASESRR